MKKRLISLFLAVCMLVGMLQVNAFDALEFMGKIVIGDVDSDGKVSVAYTGDESVSMTASIDSNPYDIVDGAVQLPDYGMYTLTVEVTAEGYYALNGSKEVTWEAPAAEPAEQLYVGGIPLADGQYLAVGATVATDAQPEGGYAYYKDGVLTLNNYTFEGVGYAYDEEPGHSAAVYASEDLEIVLEGKNSLINTSLPADGYDYNCGIYASNEDDDCNITISGDELTITAGNYGIYTEYGNVAIECSELTINAEKTGIYGGDSNVTISGSEVTIDNAEKGIYAYGIDNEGDITIEDSTIEITVSDESSIGIYSDYGNVTIDGGTTNITAAGKYSTGICTYDDYYVDGSVTISGGELTINTERYGIYVYDGDVNISGGTTKITVSGEDSVDIYDPTGIYVDNREDGYGGDVIIEDGTLEITSDYYGIYTNDGSVTISGGELTIIDAEVGIYTYNEDNNCNITISGGTTQINVSGESSDGIAIDYGDVIIEDGTIEITASGNPSTGIYTYNGNVNISGGTINVTASGADSAGIYAERGSVTIEDGTIEITSDYYGIYTEEGDITIAEPLEAYDEDGWPIEEIGNEIDGYVYISKVAPPASYPLWIGGEQFADDNLTITDGTDGTATYDPTENTLTLNNFDLTYNEDEDVPVLQIGMAYSPASLADEEEATVLTLVLEGENALRSDESYAVISVGYGYDLVIEGEGSLTIEAGEGVSEAISMIADLTVNGGIVEISSNNASIWCCDLTVTGGSLKATSVYNNTLQCYALTVTGGTVEVISQSADAICCDSLTVTGGSLKAVAGEGNMAIRAWLSEITVAEGLTIIGGRRGTYEFTWEDDEGEPHTETFYTILSGETPAASVEIRAADPIASINGTPYSTIDDALSAAQTGDTIVLLQDIDPSSFLQITKKVTLDLNGHNINNSISDAIFVLDGGNLTITDSGEGGTISSGHYGVYVQGGKLNISGGTITGGDGIVVSGGEVTITDGNISGTGSDGSGVWNVSGTVNINGGSVSGSICGVYAQGGTTNINGGTVTANSEDGVGVWLSGGTVNMEGGTVSGDGQFGYGVYVDIGTITISGDANISGDYAGVYVDIEGDDKATISGGTISGTYGVWANSGDCEITGGSITGTSIGMLNHGGDVAISGGTFTGGINISVQDGTCEITGGTFSDNPPRDYIAEGYAAKKDSETGMYVVSQIATADVSIAAVDAAAGANVLGATLQIIDSEGNVVEEWTADNEAKTVTGLMTVEEYKLRVTVAPNGYVIPTDTIFAIDEDGKITSTGTVAEDGVLLVKLSKTKVSIAAVDVDDNDELEGATLQIIDQNGYIVVEWISGHETTVVEGLNTNEEYTLYAAVAPEGYTIPADTAFVIDEDGNVTYTGTVAEDGVLLVEFSKTSVSVTANDLNDGSRLAGATLQILDKDGNVRHEWTSTIAGETIRGLKTNEEYTLRATIAPDGYTISADTAFVIDEEGNVTSAGSMSEDGVLLVEFSKTSVSVTANDLDDSEQLEGATLQILDKDGNVHEEWTSSNRTAKNITGLKTGVEYTLRATIAPAGYKIPADTTFTINENGKVTSTGSMSEDGVLLVEFSKTKVSIAAVDLNDGDELEDAILQILDNSGKVVVEWISIAEAIEVEGLKTNEEYTLRATVAPEGYITPADTQFTIDEEGNVTSTGYVEDGVLLVEFDRTSVSVATTDVDYGGTVVGATLQIINSAGNVVEEWTADNEAKTVTGLMIGEEYKLRVTVAPNGYVIPADTFFAIDEDGKITYTGTVAEDGALMVKLSKTKVSIAAVDAADGEQLEEAALQISQQNGTVVYMWTSGTEANTIEGLMPAVVYTLKATAAPDGYTIPEAANFYIDESGNVYFEGTIAEDGVLLVEFAPEEYEVEVPTIEGGEIEVETESGEAPKMGDEVTVTVTPDAGKEVDEIIVKDENGNEIPVTKNEDGSFTYEQPAGDVEIEVTVKDSEYEVEVPTIEGGEIEVETESGEAPKMGDEVTVTVTPDAGKEVDEIIVKDENGNEIPVTKNEDGSFTYEQPAGDVTIEVTLKDVRNEPTHRPSSGGTTNRGEAKVENTEGGNTKVDKKNPVKGDKVTVTTDPEAGYEVKDIIVTDEKGNKIEVKDNGDGTYSFEQPAGDVTVEVVYGEASVEVGSDDVAGGLFFADVKETDFFFDAVNWAVKNGITEGVDVNKFAPNAVCTRAQVITFLWRAAGCPAPKSNVMPFVDIPADAYYRDAVLWAVENGITSGTSETTFAPNASVTRSQTVTFLWRAEHGFEMDGEHGFADVAADAYYHDAVLWAVENGVTDGTGANTFSPNAMCTRAQIVTFLYRCMAE